MAKTTDPANGIQSAASGNLQVPPISTSKVSTGYTAGGIPKQRRQITYANVTVDHLISDAELNQLAEIRKGPVVELFWGFLGAFLGALPPALEKLPKLGNAKDPLLLGDFVTLSICVVSLAVTILMGVFWRGKETSTTSLIKVIRERRTFRRPE